MLNFSLIFATALKGLHCPHFVDGDTQRGLGRVSGLGQQGKAGMWWNREQVQTGPVKMPTCTLGKRPTDPLAPGHLSPQGKRRPGTSCDVCRWSSGVSSVRFDTEFPPCDLTSVSLSLGLGDGVGQ